MEEYDNRWISCKERLPEVRQDGDWSDDVLVLMLRYDNPKYKTGIYFEQYIGYYSPEEGWWTCMHNNCHPVGVENFETPYNRSRGHIKRTTDKIVFWMPLPKLPREGDY